MSKYTQPSIERSHIAARNVQAVQGFDAKFYEELNKFGIGIDKRMIREMSQAYGADAIFGTGMDAIQQGLTVPSVTTPVQFLQAWLPGFVNIITAVREIDEILGISTIGTFEDAQVVQGVMELTGTPVPYTDSGNVPLSSWNVNFIYRDIVRFEQGFQVTNLEELRASRIRVNSAAMKRESAGLQLEIERNRIGFFGYNAGLGLTYGLLNDPSLPAYVTVAAGAAGSTSWSKKTFLEITADIRTAVIQLRTQSQGNCAPEKGPMTLVLPINSVDYLSVTSDFNISVRTWLRDTYPSIRVVAAPQFNNANGGANVFYLFQDAVPEGSSDDGRTFIQVVPQKFYMVGVSKQTKGFEEDYSNATAGVFLKRPYAVTRFTGI